MKPQLSRRAISSRVGSKPFASTKSSCTNSNASRVPNQPLPRVPTKRQKSLQGNQPKRRKEEAKPQSQVQKRNPVPNQPSLLALQMMAPLPRAALLSFWFVFTSLATKSSRISGGSTVFQAKNPSRVQKQRPSGSPTRLLQRQR